MFFSFNLIQIYNRGKYFWKSAKQATQLLIKQSYIVNARSVEFR